MRCVPLAIWAHKCSDEEIAACCRQDACLSHPHRACQVLRQTFIVFLFIIFLFWQQLTGEEAVTSLVDPNLTKVYEAQDAATHVSLDIPSQNVAKAANQAVWDKPPLDRPHRPDLGVDSSDRR